MKELEEKVVILEELIQGFLKRMSALETEMPEFLKNFLLQYEQTLKNITAQIEALNKRYDDQKIQQQIDEVSKLMDTMPKVIGIKNHHHFGTWSKSLIIGALICYCLTATSIGTALYLKHRNNQLNREAYNYWLVRAFYPEVSKTIERKLNEDPDILNQKAKNEIEKQEAIKGTQELVEQATKKQQDAKENLRKAKKRK